MSKCSKSSSSSEVPGDGDGGLLVGVNTTWTWDPLSTSESLEITTTSNQLPSRVQSRVQVLQLPLISGQIHRYGNKMGCSSGVSGHTGHSPWSTVKQRYRSSLGFSPWFCWHRPWLYLCPMLYLPATYYPVA